MLYPRYHSNCGKKAATLGLQQVLCIHAAITEDIYSLSLSGLQLGRDGMLNKRDTGLTPNPGSLKDVLFVRLRHRFSNEY